LGERLAGSQ